MKKTLLTSALIAVFVVTIMVSTVHATGTSPQSFLLELETTVQSAKQLKDALTHKIDAVIQLIDEGKHPAAYNKLHNDIAQKLTICDTNRVRARSWLSYTHPEPQVVYDFSDVCLDLINRASIMLTQGS
jgi:hypothetical protein